MSINAFFPFSSDYIRVKTFFLTFAIPELHPGLYAGPSYMRVFTVTHFMVQPMTSLQKMNQHLAHKEPLVIN